MPTIHETEGSFDWKLVENWEKCKSHAAGDHTEEKIMLDVRDHREDSELCLERGN